MLGFGAFACFIDKDFVDHYKLSFITKKYPISVEVINGRPLVYRDVTHETTPLDIFVWMIFLLKIHLVKLTNIEQPQ